MSFMKLFNGFANTSTGLLAIGIFSTITILGSYRLIIKPKLDKNRFNQAEKFSDYIWAKENNNNQNNEKN